MADYDDIFQFVTEFGQELTLEAETFSDINMNTLTQPFALLPAHQLQACRLAMESDTNHNRWCLLPLVALLHRLDETPLKSLECYHAAMCGIEMAILDFWCKIESIPLYQLLGLPSGKHVFRKGFYTAAMNPDMQVVAEVARAEAGSTTRFLKIKVRPLLFDILNIYNMKYMSDQCRC